MPSVYQNRFLSISSEPPSANTGFQIRVLDYKDMKTLVAIMPEYTQASFTDQLSAPGVGSVTLDTDSPWWHTTLNNGLSARTLLNNEYVFEAWENGVARFAWLAQTVEESLVGEDETRTTTISGPGIAQTLTWACLMRPGWPRRPPRIGTTPSGKPKLRSHSYNDNKPAFLWQFPMKWSTMRMWYTVFKAAQRRGLIPFVTPTFTGLQDSAKRDWRYVRTLQAIVDEYGYQPQELNQSLLDFLNDCTGQDYGKWFGQRLEWQMRPGFKLDVRTRIGVDRSSQVRFFAGQILSNQRTRDREGIYNRVTAVDVEGTESIRISASSVRKWNLREQRNETNKEITDDNRRSGLADRYLAQSRDEKSEWAISIPYDDPGRVPYHHFYVGDTVGLINSDTNAGGLQAFATYRVMAISISITADSVVPTVELTLQSLIDSKLQQLEKQITSLVNNPRNFSLEDLKNLKIPEEPEVESGLVWDPKLKKWVAKPLSDYSSGGSGSGTGGPQIFVQSTDPSTEAGVTLSAGDYWLETYD